MKCLCSLLRPDSGILKIDNRQVEIADPKILLQVGTNFVNSDSLNGFMLEDIYNDHAFYYKLKFVNDRDSINGCWSKCK